MSFLKCTPAQAEQLRRLRTNPALNRRASRYDRARQRSIFAEIKRSHSAALRVLGLTDTARTKLGIRSLDPDSENYCVLFDKRTKKSLEDRTQPSATAVPVAVPVAAAPATQVQAAVSAAKAPVAPKTKSTQTAVAVATKAAKPAPAAKKAAPVKAAPVKKAATKAAPVKAAPVAKKAATKAAPVKAATKAATKAAPVKAAKPSVRGKTSPSKTAECTIEMRATVNGKRTRIGYASTEEAKVKAIAAYEKANGLA